MSTYHFRPFPKHFQLTNIANVTSRAFPLKSSPYGDEIHQTMRKWFMGFNVFDPQRTLEYIDRGRFDVFAAISFPDADIAHLETCLAFFYWAFSIDDLTDEGNLQAKPDQVQEGLDMCLQALLYPDSDVPDFPYALMVNDVIRRMRKTCVPGTCNRFIKAFINYSRALVNQSRRRSVERMLSIPEFILQRRTTIGAALVEAMVEYSLDINIPDEVFEDPIFKAMSDATTDILTWPNENTRMQRHSGMSSRDKELAHVTCTLLIYSFALTCRL